MRPICGLALAAWVSALFAGCSSDGPTTFEVAPTDYSVAFGQTREVLRDWHFNVERIDAATGVITTRPKASAGLATPWVSSQSSVRDEWQDLMTRQERRVRVTFEPKSVAESPTPPSEGGLAGSAFIDVRQTAEPVVARVEVTVDRVQRPGWQPQLKSVRQSGRMRDPDLEDRGMWPEYRVPDRLDTALAARIVREITERIADEKKASVPAQAAIPSESR